jgi:hypothetical protein
MRLLESMGHETANIHLATKGAAAIIRKDLSRRTRKWLDDAAKAMLEATVADQKQWQRHFKSA